MKVILNQDYTLNSIENTNLFYQNGGALMSKIQVQTDQACSIAARFMRADGRLYEAVASNYEVVNGKYIHTIQMGELGAKHVFGVKGTLQITFEISTGGSIVAMVNIIADVKATVGNNVQLTDAAIEFLNVLTTSQIAGVNTDLTNINNRVEAVEGALPNKADKAELEAAIQTVENNAAATYVEKVEGKDLSSNDLTDELVSKINNSVQQEAGKGLSSNDLTNELVNKINSAIQSHLTKDDILTLIGNATKENAGFMSAADASKLDDLYKLFGTDKDGYISTINEILAIFNNYPEGVNILQTINDKISTALSNEISNGTLKEKLDEKVNATDKISDAQYTVIEKTANKILLKSTAVNGESIVEITPTGITVFKNGVVAAKVDASGVMLYKDSKYDNIATSDDIKEAIATAKQYADGLLPFTNNEIELLKNEYVRTLEFAPGITAFTTENEVTLNPANRYGFKITDEGKAILKDYQLPIMICFNALSPNDYVRFNSLDDEISVTNYNADPNYVGYSRDYYLAGLTESKTFIFDSTTSNVQVRVGGNNDSRGTLLKLSDISQLAVNLFDIFILDESSTNKIVHVNDLDKYAKPSVEARVEALENLPNATDTTRGYMSAVDKARLDTLYASLTSDDDNNVVDTIKEILEIFDQYPEGAGIVTALSEKVSKAGAGDSDRAYIVTAGGLTDTVPYTNEATANTLVKRDNYGNTKFGSVEAQTAVYTKEVGFKLGSPSDLRLKYKTLKLFSSDANADIAEHNYDATNRDFKWTVNYSTKVSIKRRNSYTTAPTDIVLETPQTQSSTLTLKLGNNKDAFKYMDPNGNTYTYVHSGNISYMIPEDARKKLSLDNVYLNIKAYSKAGAESVNERAAWIDKDVYGTTPQNIMDDLDSWFEDNKDNIYFDINSFNNSSPTLLKINEVPNMTEYQLKGIALLSLWQTMIADRLDWNVGDEGRFFAMPADFTCKTAHYGGSQCLYAKIDSIDSDWGTFLVVGPGTSTADRAFFTGIAIYDYLSALSTTRNTIAPIGKMERDGDEIYIIEMTKDASYLGIYDNENDSVYMNENSIADCW